MAKPILERGPVERKRDFSYALGNVKLAFTLRTDIKEQLKAFLELMDAAKRDIEEELSNFGK